MIPGSTDGVNYYRMAAWAFEMRKYKNVIVDLLWFQYEINPEKLGLEDHNIHEPHPWQKHYFSQQNSADWPGHSLGEYIRATIDRACELADVVIWHPIWYPQLFEFFLEMQHKHQKPFVIETDDNYLDVPQWNAAFHGFKQGSEFRSTAIDSLRNADAVVTTTPHLKETYAKFNENIFIVPNSLDFKGDRKFVGWDKVSVRKHRGVRVGWIGGRTHFDDIMSVAPVLRDVLDEFKNVKLVLVNSALKRSCELLGKPYPFEGRRVLEADRSVAINRYAPFAASFGFDIGIAPLVDCNFNRSKSNLRWLEYSAMKVPSVCQNVGHFATTINHGKDGLLVTTPEEWGKALRALVSLPSLREEIGREAYKRVKHDFNVKRNTADYVRKLKEIADFNSRFEEAEETWTDQNSSVSLAI